MLVRVDPLAGHELADECGLANASGSQYRHGVRGDLFGGRNGLLMLATAAAVLSRLLALRWRQGVGPRALLAKRVPSVYHTCGMIKSSPRSGIIARWGVIIVKGKGEFLFFFFKGEGR